MNFDRLAPHYDWMEILMAGSLLQRVRTGWLDQLVGRQRILSIGEGHGRFASACVARYPNAELTCVEASPRMLDRARKHTRGIEACIHWHVCDFLDWVPDGKYDAVVTCFVLDCFRPETLEAVLDKLVACSTADAVWLNCDFAVPQRGFARLRARAIHCMMYGFFRVLTSLPAKSLTTPDDLLRAREFQLKGRKEYNLGLLRADIWQRVSGGPKYPSGHQNGHQTS